MVKIFFELKVQFLGFFVYEYINIFTQSFPVGVYEAGLVFMLQNFFRFGSDIRY
jgi:hypothetical protein